MLKKSSCMLFHAVNNVNSFFFLKCTACYKIIEAGWCGHML